MRICAACPPQVGGPIQPCLSDFFARARAEEARMSISRNGKAVQLIFGRDHGRTSSKDTVTELEAR